MGFQCSSCKNLNQQVSTYYLKTNEANNNEEKQQFKHHLNIPAKQYFGEAHPIIQVKQDEKDEIDLLDFQFKMNKIIEQDIDFNDLHFLCGQSNEQLFYNSKNRILEKKPKLKRKQRSMTTNCKRKIVNTNIQKESETIFYFLKGSKEFQFRYQRNIINSQTITSFSRNSILKKFPNRKIKSISPWKRVSFAINC